MRKSIQYSAISGQWAAFAIFLLFAALTAPRSALGATITGPLQNRDTTPFVGTIIFRPVTERVAVSSPTIFVYGDTRVTTAANGGFTNVLSFGNYLVLAGPTLPFKIAVPNDTSTYTLISLISTAVLQPSDINVSTAVSSIAAGKLDITNGVPVGMTGGSLWGTFAVTNGSLTFDGVPGGGGGTWPRSFSLKNFDYIQNSQANHVSWYGVKDATIAGGNLYIATYTNLYFNTPEIASFSLSTNAVPVLSDPVTGQVKFVPLESLQLGSTVTSGKVIGKKTSTQSIASGTVDLDDVASATTTAAAAAARVRQVATVPAMVALTGISVGDSVLVNDTAGRPPYVYRSTSYTTNLGTIFTATGMGSGQWVANYSGPANFAWYGAVGDYSTDCTSAITNAVEYHANAANGVTPELKFNAGRFLTSLAGTNHGNLIVRGSGNKGYVNNTTQIFNTTANSPGWVFAADAAFSSLTDVALSPSSPSSIATTDTNSYGVYCEPGSYMNNVERVSTYGHNYGLGEDVNGSAWQYTFNSLQILGARKGWIRWGGGTQIVFNKPFFQNGDYNATNYATITNITVAAGTNLTFTLSSTVPANIDTNFLFTVTGSQANLNTRYVTKTISGNVITASANTTISSITTPSGTLSMTDGLMSGVPINLGQGDFSFTGADFEHTTLNSGYLVYSQAYLLTFDSLRLESVNTGRGTSACRLFTQAHAGTIDLRSLIYISSGIAPGVTMYALNPLVTNSAVNIGNIYLQDDARGTSTLNLALTSGGSETPFVKFINYGDSNKRAGVNNQFDSLSGVDGLSANGTTTYASAVTVQGATTTSGGLSTTTLAASSTATLSGNVTLGSLANVASAAHTTYGTMTQKAQGQTAMLTLMNASQRPELSFRRENGTISSPTKVVSGNTVGFISFTGDTDSAGTYARSSYINALAEEDYSASALGTSLLFYNTKVTTTSNVQGLTLNGYGSDVYVNAGDLLVDTAGKTLKIKSGSNALSGTVTLTAGVGTITSSAITTSTVIDLSLQSASGVRTGALDVIVSAGSATVTTVSTDAGTYVWTAIKKN